MANNPVQIILNDADFLRAPDPGTGGLNKDFFENADGAFNDHKARLLAAVDDIIDSVENSEFGPATYLRVEMRDEALAKSYRPVTWLFKQDQFPCVGAGAVGTLYFRAPLIYLSELRRRIDVAEETVKYLISKNTGKSYPATSAARSEVGAISTMEIAAITDKRDFSTAEAMEMFADPKTVSGYYVELFETPTHDVIADDPLGRLALLKSLEQILVGFGPGARTLLATKVGRTPVLELQITKSDEPAILDNRLGLARRDVAPLTPASQVDLSAMRHEEALNRLAQHPLVRSIQPPIQLQNGSYSAAHDNKPNDYAEALIQIPSPVPGAVYPIIGIIDSGFSNILSSWLVGRFDYLDPGEFDEVHGTQVAGLATLGQSLNTPHMVADPDGCMLYDIPLFPNGEFLKKYRNGFLDFLEELEQAVIEAKEDHGVRIFNLSINVKADVDRHKYGIYAARLDQIADTHGVIFVNSAGNLHPNRARSPWQKRPSDVIKYLAARTDPDTIYQPSESVRSISVGALNPPDTTHVDSAPATYTARGPGLQVGVKPDVATYGGAGVVGAGKTTGLNSLDKFGLSKNVVGTSFAAPLVARTLAHLDQATQSTLTTEGLRAMLLHHSVMPAPLSKRGMKDISRQFAGYGQPTSVINMLETDDHEVTLVFQSRLTIGARKPAILRFPFSWPQSLVGPQSQCSGCVKMTLVYSPPLDPAFGAEFVRVNLEGSLRQRQKTVNKDGKFSYTNQIDARFLPKTAGLAVPEKALIAHGLKWWPSKQYESNLNERGETSDWRLEVTSLIRAESVFPVSGVPFAVLLTIRDPDGNKPIFAEMRQALQASQAEARDIRATARLRQRG